jgi:type II secretory pathway pseudopilin PulG
MGIIALLVAVALPRYTRARRQAHRSEMQSDLRNLLSAEEAYFDEYYQYSSNLASLEFNSTPNVTIQFVDVSSSGWSARTTHVNTSAQCGVYVGTSTMPSGIPVSAEGAVSCTEAN